MSELTRDGTVISRDHITFADVLTVVHQRLAEDTVILAELVRLKEPPTSMGPERVMDYVHRAV